MTEGSNKRQSVAAVVLTMKRYEKLKITIESLRNQTRTLDEIIVVFQGTNKKIKDWLEQQEDITLHIQGNLGSAGGFSTGMQLAIDNGHDWVWVTDDDAFPELDALQNMVSSKHFDDDETGLLTCVVVDADGRTYMSPVPDDANKWYGSVLEDKCLPITSSAWPGCLIATKAIKAFGLPVKEYFFYDEDVEFTTRIARQRPSFCVINAVFNHHQEPSSNLWQSPERYKPYVRNKFSTIRLSGDPGWKKLAKQFAWIMKISGSVFIGEKPIGALVPLVTGFFFFRPKIQYPN